MKQFKYKSVTTATKTKVEKEIVVKPEFNRRPIFFFVLIILALLVVFIIKKHNKYETKGQILCEKVGLKLPENTKVLKYYFKAGDTIHKGDTLFKLQTILKLKDNQQAEEMYEDTTVSWFFSTYNGIVANINMPLNKLINNTDIVIDFFDLDKLYIECFVKKVHISAFPEKEIVKVYFDNGTKSYGRVSDIILKPYVNNNSKQILSEETKKKVLITIDPVSDKDIALWKTYYMKTVEISK